ncbi:MAG: hypothetical protein ACYDH4_08590 [Candidatus Cryosericum sp.]
MNKHTLWSRILCVVGLAAMTAVPALLLGYTFNHLSSASARSANVLLLTSLILPVLGSGLAALGARRNRSRYRAFLCGVLAPTVGGLTAIILILIFSPGYFDFEATNLPLWIWVTFAYPIGVIMSCVGAVLVIVDSFGGPPVPKDDDERNTYYLSP